MTREEAVIILDGFKSNPLFSHTHAQALDMAISALSENKGEWIEVVTERFPNGEKQMWHYDCSVCSTGEPPCPINKEHWDFCPNCGADMREVSE